MVVWLAIILLSMVLCGEADTVVELSDTEGVVTGVSGPRIDEEVLLW